MAYANRIVYDQQQVKTAKIYSAQERLNWVKIKAPWFSWASKKSQDLKHSPAQMLLLQILVLMSDHKGLCEVGIEAQLKKLKERYKVEISQRTAERYIALFKKQGLIKKEELDDKYTSHSLSTGKKTVNRFRKTYSTRLLGRSTANMAVIIYNKIYMNPESVAKPNSGELILSSAPPNPPMAEGAKEPHPSDNYTGPSIQEIWARLKAERELKLRRSTPCRRR